MKRFVTLCVVLLMASVAGAQEMPIHYVSDYFGVGGPFEIDSVLVDYRAPWSTPDVFMSYVFFGTVTFDVSQATVVDHTFAHLFCTSGFCVAYNPRSVLIETVYEWNPSYHTYAVLNQYGSSTQYDVLALDLSGSEPTAHRYYGGYTDHWVLSDAGVYTDHFVQLHSIPIVQFLSPFTFFEKE